VLQQFPPKENQKLDDRELAGANAILVDNELLAWHRWSIIWVGVAFILKSEFRHANPIF
jgi:hypothetical protein